MPSRRTVLGSVSSAMVGSSLLAGCVGDADGTREEATPTTSTPASSSLTGDAPPTETATGTPPATDTPYYDAPCEAVEKNWADPQRDEFEPRELPEGPPEFDRDAVREFVRSYENAYFYNRQLQRHTKELSVGTGHRSVEPVPGGFLVVVEVTLAETIQGTPNGNETVTAAHGDAWDLPVAYLVTRKRLVRKSGGEEPDPREDGTTVECWDEKRGPARSSEAVSVAAASVAAPQGADDAT